MWAKIKTWIHNEAHWLRAAALSVTSVVWQVLSQTTPDVVLHWSWKRWAIGLLFVLIPAWIGYHPGALPAVEVAKPAP